MNVTITQMKRLKRRSYSRFFTLLLVIYAALYDSKLLYLKLQLK